MRIPGIRSYRIAAVLWLVLAAPRSLAAQPVRRFAPDSLWRRLWVVGAERSSDLFVEPRQVVASGPLVAVLDMGTREVRGFDARSGAPRLVLLARGQGPGEFKRPDLLVPTPTGFAVVDQASGRLSAFARSGRLEWDVQLPEPYLVGGICVSRGRFLVAYRRPDSALVAFDTTGRRWSVQVLPWRTPRRTDISFAHEIFASAEASGRCAFVRYFGGEWATASTGRSAPVRTFPLVEAGAEPVARRTERVIERRIDGVTYSAPETADADPIAKNILRRGDTVIVHAAKSRTFPHRLLDYYDGTTGAYLFSRRLPFTIVSLAIGSDGTFFGTVIDESTQALVAFRPERPISVAAPPRQRLSPRVSPPRRDTLARHAGPPTGPRRGSP